jgi:starvation-inducible DNA-binding protein
MRVDAKRAQLLARPKKNSTPTDLPVVGRSKRSGVSRGGIAVAMATDVSQMTKIERVPHGREEVPVQISRLLEAHEHILVESRALARKAAELGDDGTNDLLVSEVVRTNEAQVWFVSEHVVDTPLVRAK